MTEEEITKDLEARATILNWASENKLNEIDDVGKIMKVFYSEPDILKRAAESNESPEKVFGGKK